MCIINVKFALSLIALWNVTSVYVNRNDNYLLFKNWKNFVYIDKANFHHQKLKIVKQLYFLLENYTKEKYNFNNFMRSMQMRPR